MAAEHFGIPIPSLCMDMIFNLLDYNTCLKLRQVNKAMKSEVDGRIENNTITCKSEKFLVVTLDTGEKSFSEFMKITESEMVDGQPLYTPLPIRRLYFKAGSADWTEFLHINPYLTIFMQQRAAKVTHLKLGDGFETVWTSLNAFRFLDSFSNLVSLEIMSELQEATVHGDMTLLPVAFNNLKVLNIYGNFSRDIWNFIDKVVKTNILEELRLGDNLRLPNNIFNVFFDWLRSVNAFKVMRLPSYAFIKPRSLEMLMQLEVRGTILQDVKNSHIRHFYSTERYLPCIQSINRADPECFCVEFPYLEKIHLAFTSAYIHELPPAEQFAQWNNLKAFYFEGCSEDDRFMEFAFGNIVRPHLETLFLTFQRTEDVSLLRPVDIQRTCPNLKQFILRNCNWNNQSFLNLWPALRNVEYLQIIGCQNLGDCGFVGDESHLNEPVFLKLTRLRYLEITRLFNMPLITGQILETVISKLPLQFLRLSSYHMKEMKEIYEDLLSSPSQQFQIGHVRKDSYTTANNMIRFRHLESLKNGVLSSTIKKLDFTGLLIEDVTSDQLQKFCVQVVNQKFTACLF